MKNFISVILFCFLFFNAFAKQNTSEELMFFNNLKKSISEDNKKLPFNGGNGFWYWSEQLENKTVIVVFKFNGIYDSQDISLFENIANTLPVSFLVNLPSKDRNDFFKYKVSFKIKFLTYKNDKSIFEKSFSSSQLKKMINEDTFVGKRPLSYYKNGFESQKSTLPQNVTYYLEFFDVNMDKNDVFFDYYLKDDMKDSPLLNTFVDENISFVINSSSEFKQDIKTYGIKFHFRFYSKSNKKLLKEIVKDLSK